MVDVAGLHDYRWSSYWYLQHPAKRPSFMDLSGCLEAAGGLADTTAGRKKYREYLAWLSADTRAQKELLFDRMCRGWAIGSKDFKKGLLREEAERVKAEAEGTEVIEPKRERYDGKELREANELKWELYLERGLSALGKDTSDIREDIKSAAWKVMLAAVIKGHASATNVWITQKLNMGISQAVSQNVGKFRAAGGGETEAYQELIINITI